MNRSLKTFFSITSVAALVLLTAVGCASTQSQAVDSTLVDSAEGSVVMTGQFEGRNDHITTGKVSILKTSTGYIARLENNFSLDGAPAPTLGFGKTGSDQATVFTKLNNKDGYQLYAIPATIAPASYDEFYVWCADFNVPLGVAKLNKK